ncbi:hypothetical protein [Streptomyces erythrochromogenes]|uniref:hypothetical protein n=1 Tax=Streptomyces erythrochromogenes TaxID=285574 RepID=UPI0036B86AC0
MSAVPTHVYVMTPTADQAGKVGIAALDSIRIQQHRRQGWALYRALLLPSQEDARQVEGAVLRRLGGRAGYVLSARMRQGGYRETVSLDQVPRGELWDLVVSAAKDVAAEEDRSRVVVFLAGGGERGLFVGTDRPAGASRSSPESEAGDFLEREGCSVYAANTTAAEAETALRALWEWAARTAVTDIKTSLHENPDGLEELRLALRHAYLLPEPADEAFKEARIALGVPLHPVSYA